MATLSIVEVSEKPWKQRWELLQQFLAEHKITFSHELIESPIDKVTENVKAVLAKNPHAIIVNPAYSENLITSLFTSTLESFMTGACDVIFRDKEVWWPRCLVEQAFIKAIKKYVKEVDSRRGALIVGANGAARLLAPALTQLGYKSIHIADENDEVGKQLIQYLKNKIFDVDFKFIDKKQITQLKGIYSMAINALSMYQDHTILDELYFFNFLSRDAVVIDLNLIPFKTPLITEAEKFGTRFLSGVYIWGEYDVEFAKSLTGIELDPDKYVSTLVEKNKAVEFDVTSMLERF